MCCDWRTYPFLYPLAEQYLTVRNLLVWKKHIGQGAGLYRYSHELIMFAVADRSGSGEFKSADIIEGVKPEQRMSRHEDTPCAKARSAV